MRPRGNARRESGHRKRYRRRQNVGKNEAIAGDNFARYHINRLTEEWTSIDESVKFTPFPARVDAGRQIPKEGLVVLAAGKGRV